MIIKRKKLAEIIKEETIKVLRESILNIDEELERVLGQPEESVENDPEQLDEGVDWGLIDDYIYSSARRHSLPAWILLATKASETNKDLDPTGSDWGKTFYPMGIQRNRGIDTLKRYYKKYGKKENIQWSEWTQEELDNVLSDPRLQIELAAFELARGWRKYKNTPDSVNRIRVFWGVPAGARKAKKVSWLRCKMNRNCYKEWEYGWSGKWPWSYRLPRWERQVRKALGK